MKKILFASLFLLFSAKAFAILPPLYHGIHEIKSILNDRILHEKLGSGQMIQEIKRVDSGYDIITADYLLHVDVEYIHTGKIGPGEFNLHFSEPVKNIAE